jgi:hypothetical protein
MRRSHPLCQLFGVPRAAFQAAQEALRAGAYLAHVRFFRWDGQTAVPELWAVLDAVPETAAAQLVAAGFKPGDVPGSYEWEGRL